MYMIGQSAEFRPLKALSPPCFPVMIILFTLELPPTSASRTVADGARQTNLSMPTNRRFF